VDNKWGTQQRRGMEPRQAESNSCSAWLAQPA